MKRVGLLIWRTLLTLQTDAEGWVEPSWRQAVEQSHPSDSWRSRHWGRDHERWGWRRGNISMHGYQQPWRSTCVRRHTTSCPLYACTDFSVAWSVCLSSVVCHTRLNRSTDLDAIWQVHLWGPMRRGDLGVEPLSQSM